MDTAVTVAVEPTQLAFNLNCAVNGNSSGIANFRTFARRLQGFFQSLHVTKTRIAMTRSLMHLYQNEVPYIVYQPENRSLALLARDAFGPKLRQYSRVVHEYGRHQYDVRFTSGVSDPLGLISQNDVYLEWLDLLGLLLDERLPRLIVQDRTATVFTGGTCVLEDGQTGVSCTAIVSELETRVTEQALAIWRLAVYISKVEPAKYCCSGTGNHDSMWGCKIRSLDDVPTFERHLLTGLFDLGIVEEVTLLDFPDNYPPAVSPFIELLPPGRGQQHGVLRGRLRGRGQKQNAQNLVLKLRPGMEDFIEDMSLAMLDLALVERLQKLREAI